MNTILTFSVVAFCTIQTIFCDETLEVEVQQGWLRGKKLESVCKEYYYYSFENIPYAAPPVGQLRFKAPEEPKKWEGTRDATALGPMCPQYNPLTNVYNEGSEDCLTCNVYTPNISGKLPVLFFLSGFAYSFDGDVVGLYGPDFLVKDMVVVQCQYRQDALGFLNLGTIDVPGNAGCKDQVAALQWVHNNIHVFGGDPDSVTIAGISSGSASIYHHMMSSMSTKLFHRAIMMSGVPFCDAVFPYQVKEKSFYLGKKLGLETEDGNEMLNFLQTVPYEKLVNSSYSIAREDPNSQLLKKMSTFVPVVEQDFGQKRFITVDPMTSIDSAPLNKVELMIGFCNLEALIIVNECKEYLIQDYKENIELAVPNQILYKVTTSEAKKLHLPERIIKFYHNDKDISVKNIKEFMEMTSFASIIYETLRFTQKISQFIVTYLFEFKSLSNRNIYGLEGLKYGIEGAGHGDLLPYLFTFTPLNMTVDFDSKEYPLIKQIVTPVRDFVIDGNPSKNMEISWAKFTPEEQNYVQIADQVTAKQNPRLEEYKFWESIYSYTDDVIQCED